MIHLDVLNPRQAEAGKIKIGRLGEERNKRSGNGTYQLPEKQDFFTITTTERGDDGNFEIDEALMDQLRDTEGCADDDKQIRRLPILLSSDDIEEVFPTSLMCYAGRSLHCIGDGKNEATRYDQDRREGGDFTIKTRVASKVACPCKYLNAKEGNQCRPHGTLWCTIMAGSETQIGARHSFRTTSWNSIRSILAGLLEIQRMIGTLVGPQLWLYVRPQKVTPAGGTAKTVFVVHVRCKAKDIQELRERVLQQAQLRHNVAQTAGRPLKLGHAAPGDAESPLDQSHIQQEFHPDDDETIVYDPDGEPIVYDSKTGEVLNTDAVDPPSPEPGSQAPEDPDAEWPESHPGRTKLKDLCTEAAKAREFTGDSLRQGTVELYVEARERAKLPGLPWGSLTTARAQRIGEELTDIIDEANSNE